MDNNTLAVIELENNKDYIENYLNQNGVFVVMPSYAWNYLDQQTMNVLLKASGEPSKPEYSKAFNPLMDDDLLVNNTNNKLEFNKEDSLLNEDGSIDSDKLKKEKDINNILSKDGTPNIASPDVIKILKNKLNKNESITPDNQYRVTSKSVSWDNLINDIKDEENEGKKIIKWINEKFVKKFDLFNDLRMYIANGYVHLARTGVQVNDIITEDLVPNLSIFQWQYDIPIEYDSLKYIMFRKNISKDDVDAQKEAEKILSQENIIALQPTYKFQFWTLKRLITAWYADEDLAKNIRKIKILINTWRTRYNTDFNKKYGVLPSILIYPKYGKKSARIVSSIINKYFLFYTNISTGTKPSYFIKMNDLMYYTNGSLNIKLYKDKK